MLETCIVVWLNCQPEPTLEVTRLEPVIEIESKQQSNWKFEWTTVCRYPDVWQYNSKVKSYELKCANHSYTPDFSGKINMLNVTYHF